MDSPNHKYPTGSHQALKRMIPQLLISVSLFSFALSYSSLYTSLTASSASQKFHHYFSAAASFRLLSKNCLFLICNGLLVFLSKTSGFIQPPPSAHDLNDVLQPTAAPIHISEPEESSGDGGGKSAEQVSIFIAESEEEVGEADRDSDEEDAEVDDQNRPESAGCWLFDDDAEQLYGQPDDEDEYEDGDEDEDEGGEKREEMSTEELNRKFEEFIRKMKEEIIVNEARHKLLMLNSS